MAPRRKEIPDEDSPYYRDLAIREKREFPEWLRWALCGLVALLVAIFFIFN